MLLSLAHIHIGCWYNIVIVRCVCVRVHWLRVLVGWLRFICNLILNVCRSMLVFSTWRYFWVTSSNHGLLTTHSLNFNASKKISMQKWAHEPISVDSVDFSLNPHSPVQISSILNHVGSFRRCISVSHIDGFSTWMHLQSSDSQVYTKIKMIKDRVKNIRCE